MNHLDEKTIQELKVKLEEEKGKLEKELGELGDVTERKGEYQTRFDDIGRDRDDNASEVEEYSDNLALESNLEADLREVVKALERIKDGTYGYCANCGESIDIGRLMAYPAANSCIKCKK